MSEIIVDRENAEAAHTSKTASQWIEPAAARELVLPRPGLSPLDRLQIYNEMYFLRLRNALRSDFPALSAVLGKAAFDALVQGYLDRHPSHHPSVGRLGAHLPEYLEASRPEDRFLAELAYLEWTCSEVFDARDVPAAALSALEALPPERRGDLRFEPRPTTRLLAFQYPVNSFYQAFLLDTSEGTTPVPPDPQPSWTVVYRKDYSVWRLDLTAPAAAILSALLEAMTLGEAIDAAGEGIEVLDAASLFALFRDWVGESLFARIAP